MQHEGLAIEWRQSQNGGKQPNEDRYHEQLAGERPRNTTTEHQRPLLDAHTEAHAHQGESDQKHQSRRPPEPLRQCGMPWGLTQEGAKGESLHGRAGQQGLEESFLAAPATTQHQGTDTPGDDGARQVVGNHRRQGLWGQQGQSHRQSPVAGVAQGCSKQQHLLLEAPAQGRQRKKQQTQQGHEQADKSDPHQRERERRAQQQSRQAEGDPPTNQRWCQTPRQPGQPHRQHHTQQQAGQQFKRQTHHR